MDDGSDRNKGIGAPCDEGRYRSPGLNVQMGQGKRIRGRLATRNRLKAPLNMDENIFPQVEIGELALKAMLSLCEQTAHLETGGILVGSYSADGAQAHVNEALGPPPGSQSTPTEFTRNTGLGKALKRRWPQQQYYLGEWHSHPRGTHEPVPPGPAPDGNNRERRRLLLPQSNPHNCGAQQG